MSGTHWPDCISFRHAIPQYASLRSVLFLENKATALKSVVLTATNQICPTVHVHCHGLLCCHSCLLPGQICRVSISSTRSYDAPVQHRLASAIQSTIVQPVLKCPDCCLPTPTSLVVRSVGMRSSSDMPRERQINGQTHETLVLKTGVLLPCGSRWEYSFLSPFYQVRVEIF